MATVEIATSHRLETVLKSAWRRFLLVAAWEQLPLMLATVLGGVALTLLLGTDKIPAYLLLLLSSASAGVAFFRIRQHILPRYRVAQIVDHRLGLNDTLSTACYLLTNADDVDQRLAAYQISQAEALAPSVKLKQAFPLAGSRLWVVTASLAVVAAGLFAGRYLITGSLSLQHGLIPLEMTSIFEQKEHPQAPPPASRAGAGQQQGMLHRVPEPQANEGQSEQAPMPPAQTSEAEGQTTAGTGSQNSPSAKSGKPGDNKSDNQASNAGNSQNALNEEPQQAASEHANPQSAANSKQEPNNSEASSPSLLNKVKDALSSLMAKMHPNAGEPKAQGDNSQTPSGNKAGDQQTAGKSQQQSQQQTARNEQSAQEQSAEGQAQGQSTEKAKASQGRNTDESPQKGSDAHSGIGRQDGDKSVKEAEQLKAMGKLAEIIGKRSESLTGEMMVETSSGKQQLKTAYSQKMGHHADLGGEINRDEIPLSAQQYVREYMERVRKQDQSVHNP